MNEQTYYLSSEKKNELIIELQELKEHRIPALARRIDDAKQLGDLSENAEYHAAREDMGWAQGRVEEIMHILDNATLISSTTGSTVQIGSTIVVKVNGNEREFSIVGAQEANPLQGKISNESPLGKAFLGKKKGDTIHVDVPAGVQVYEIKNVE